METQQNVAIIYIPPQKLIQFVLGRTHIVSGIPDSVSVVNCGFDVQRNHFYLILADESFPATPEGELIPSLHVLLENV